MSITVELKLIGIPNVTCGPLPQGRLEGPTTFVVTSPDQALTGVSITDIGRYKIDVLDAGTKEVLATSNIFDVEYEPCKDSKLGNCPPPVVVKKPIDMSQRMRIAQKLMNRRQNRGTFKYITPTVQQQQYAQNTNRPPINKFR